MSDISRALSPLPQQFVLRETRVVPVIATDEVQVCVANPLRWGLIITGSGGGAVSPTKQCWASTIPGNATIALGYPFSGYQGNFEFYFRDWAILVQQAWYACMPSATAPVAFNVFELLIQQ